MPSPTPSPSIWSRKRDLVYLIFFVIHIPTIFTNCKAVVDAVPLLPTALQTDLAHQIRAFYVSSYNDKFFAEPPPPWFTAFIAMELFYHAPLSLWAIPALIRDNAMVPVHLLAFGVQAFVTSLACLVQVWSWEDRTVAQKRSITMLYGPYVALGWYPILLCLCFWDFGWALTGVSRGVYGAGYGL
ncbi:integral membrane protein, putative [Aspergillus fumigatus A1163]|uniref:Integral membrane protein, putative n=1 Tax=Aspergillus fumigatus (strain CBS 144.89 / FGSC A1163 / CEA10) TaxID=451804 RepID=B0YB55_ASPFC|nr:integral membrane protein, putative [Aspergillus fumigatus A1163]KMK56206.1 integral membrane protein, putative [Aspergillus fumigatus Z5]